MPLTQHPLRRELVREMHLRRFAPVTAPALIVQMVCLVEEDARAAERKRLNTAAQDLEQHFDPDRRHAVLDFDGVRFLWERHTEATTITAIADAASAEKLDEVVEWMMAWPGEVLRAPRIHVEADEKAALARLPEMQFEESDLVCCEVNAGVKLWSDFRIRADGFGRMVMTAGNAQPDELGRIIQRVQELGNYRNLALLALPPTRRLMPRLGELEDLLAGYSQELGSEGGRRDEDLLADLSKLSAELARIRVDTGFRLGASHNYAQIAADRLEGLEVRSCKGFMSLTDFTERRLVPAMRTCDTFESRLRSLSERSGDAIALLSTRIDTRIKAQNLDLLRSMESTFDLQLRLQHLVEALSIVAASYYAVGLVAYMLKGAKAFPAGDTVDMAIALLTPLIILGMFVLMSRTRKRFLSQAKH